MSVPNGAESDLDWGNRLYQQGNLLGAQRCYETAIAQNSNDARAYYNLGVVLNDRGLFELAQQSYETAIALQPDYLKAYSNLGGVLVESNKISEAIAVYRRAIALNPNWAPLHHNLGLALQAQGKPDEALSAYALAIELQPERVSSYYNCGKICQDKNEHSQAVRYFQRCIELDPNYREAYSDCGYSLMALGELKAAMQCFQTAIAFQPEFVEFYCNEVERTLASSSRKAPLDERDRAQISCARFLKALQSNFHRSEVEEYLAQSYLYWGNVLLKYGSEKRAIHSYHQSLQIKPNNLEAYRQLSQCLEKSNRFDPVAVVGESCWESTPVCSSALARSIQAIALLHNTKPDGVYRESRQWIETVNLEGSQYIFIEEESTLPDAIAPPDFPTEEDCGGLNCVPCLSRIYRELSPRHWGDKIYSFPPKNIRAIADSPARFVVVVPQGRAWIVAQTASWMVCNAIAIVTPDNSLLADVSREYPGALPGCQKQEPTKHRIFEREELPPLTEIDGTVAVLSGLSGNVYFHWLTDILPRIEILRQSGIKWEEIDYFLVNSIEQPFQRETLARLGIPETKIIESDRYPHIRATRLLVPSFPGHLGWLTPWALQFLRQTFLQPMSASGSDYPERIYISRAQARYRRLINEPEVIEFLTQFGFQTIVTESLSFSEQIQVFSHAKIIIALHGSGLTNLAFCRPGTLAIELVSPHYVRPYYAVICQLLGLSHYVVTGEAFGCYPLREVMYQSPLTEDLRISLDKLHAILKIAGIIISNESGAISTPMQATVNPETAAVQLNRQAEACLARGKFTEAEAACLQAVKLAPNSAAAYKTLGNVFQGQGKLKEARQSYIKAIEIDPNFAAAYANLGSLYGQQQQWKSAIACYQRAIKINPKFAGAYRNLAKVWMQLQKPAEAAECWYWAWSLEPDKFSAVECVNLGNALVQQREVERGIACYQRALELNPNLGGVYHNLAEALRRQGKVEEAAIYEKKALGFGMKAAEPFQQNGPTNGSFAWGKDAEALLHIGEYYYQKGKLAEAIAACEKAVVLQPNLAVVYKVLGNARLAGGQLELARQCYVKALQIQPNFAEVYANLGSVLAQQQHWQQAIAAYQKALQLRPNFAGAYRNLAYVLERIGKVQEAAICRYRALGLDPGGMSAEECLKLGNALIAEGKQEEALICYRRALELDPKLSPGYHNIGEILSSKQEWEGAIAAYRQAIALSRENGRSYYGLAKVLAQLERWEEAVKAYQQAIQLKVSSAEIYQQLGDVLTKLQRWEEVASAYRQAIALNPQNSRSHHNLGGALTKLQRWDEAIAAYCRAIALNPKSGWTYYSLGEALVKQQQWDEAVRAYQQAVKLQPDLPWISQKLGDALRHRAMSDFAAALGCYRQAIQEHPEDLQNYYKALEIQPDDAKLYVQLANQLAKQGNSDGAIVFYQMALQLQPNDAEILQQLEDVSKKKAVTLPPRKIEIEKANNLSSTLEQAKQFLKSTSQIALDSLLNTSARIEIPYVENPEVSIILVLYNRAELTLNCLSSILQNNFKSLELIIVDNASTDNTQRLLKRIQGATILYNSENLHFIRACNQAVECANGEFLLFLNNDTQILGDSIAAAVKTLKSADDIGAVGGKIILPDGKLQEAGSIIWRDGSCLGYGRGNSPLAPEYMFRRSVDYCSGAFLLTPRDLFVSMGGFDEAYLPAYYEETDYCIKLWKAGKRVVYEPNVVLMHYEFASSSSRENATQLQVKNKRIFVEKHKDWLESQYLPKLENSLFARTSAKQSKKRILFIDDRVPHSFLGSGYPRSNLILSCMVELGYAVTFYPMDVSRANEDWAEVYTDVSQSVEVTIGYGYPKLAEFLQARQGYYDVVFVSRPHNMSILKSCLEQNKNLLKGSKIIYDAEALYCLREIEQMRLRGENPSPEEVEQLIQKEVSLAVGCDRIISVSEQEKQKFVDRGFPNTEVLGHAVSISPTPKPFNKRKDILFVGAIYEMNSPNADSVQWLATEIFPKIQAKLGQEVKLLVAGNNTVEQIFKDIRQLGNPSIEMLGKVEDLTFLYNHARLFVAPTRFAAGIPLKICEVAARGIPVITTSLIAQQLGWQHEVELLVADDAEQFAAACAKIYQDEFLWKKLRQNALNRIQAECSSSLFSEKLKSILKGSDTNDFTKTQKSINFLDKYPILPENLRERIVGKKNEKGFPQSRGGNTGKYSRFIIICPARSGSTMLMHSLNSHPEIICHGEVMAPESRADLVGLNWDIESPLRDKLTELREQDPISFLDTFVLHPGSYGAVGLKFKYEELSLPSYKAVLDYLISRKDILIIYLTRKNLLKRYLSQTIAIQVTKIFWISNQNERPDNVRIRLDVQECLNEFKFTEERQQRFRGYFQEHRVMELTYEDLLTEYESAMERLQTFLGVKLQKLSIPGEKVLSDNIEDIIENLSELKDYFKGTKYEVYLH